MAGKPKKPKPGPESGPPAAFGKEFMAELEALFEASQQGEDDLDARELIEIILDTDSEQGDVLRNVVEELQEVLAGLRIEANGGSREAREESEDLRDWLAEVVLDDPGMDGKKLIYLAQAFGSAEFDPGPAFAEAFAARGADEQAEGPAVDLPELLADLVSETQDPFEIYAGLSQFTRFMPAQVVTTLAGLLSISAEEPLREAALGFLLEADDAVADLVCRELVASAARTAPSSRLVERLVRLRALMPPARHGALDDAVKALRPRAGAPVPAPEKQIDGPVASLSDGSGAQVLLAHIKEGRTNFVASLMIKLEHGIVDATLIEDMPRREFKRLSSEEGMAARKISRDLLVRRLCAALADNHAGGRRVPFGLLSVMEKLDLPALRPDPFDPKALFDEILGQPFAEAARRGALDAAMKTVEASGLAESWFEAGEAVDKLFDTVRPRKLRLDLLLKQYLPGRRRYWAAQCAWSVAVLRETGGKDKALAHALALLGGHLCSDGPLADNPLMRSVAEISIEAYMAQRQ